MWSGVCVNAGVHLSACLSHRLTAATAAHRFTAEQPVSRRYWLIAAGTGTLQQMRVASCWQPMEEAQHRLVYDINIFYIWCHVCYRVEYKVISSHIEQLVDQNKLILYLWLNMSQVYQRPKMSPCIHSCLCYTGLFLQWDWNSFMHKTALHWV